MVDRQLRARGVHHARVLDAMGTVPREAFVPDEYRGLAYGDGALPIAGGQTISQPYIVARMTELLDPRPGDRVLEVGGGSGYQAAVLAEMGCRVTSIERMESLAVAARDRLAALGYGDRVEVRVGDGSLGDPAGAPWPRIIVAAAAPRIPVSLREQLDPDAGRLVIPVGGRWEQELLLVVRHGQEWLEASDGACIFVPLLGAEGFPAD
jgi:protein-L-isoaspartate(D-aspartate) O-methyltransferase